MGRDGFLDSTEEITWGDEVGSGLSLVGVLILELIGDLMTLDTNKLKGVSDKRAET